MSSSTTTLTVSPSERQDTMAESVNPLAETEGTSTTGDGTKSNSTISAGAGALIGARRLVAAGAAQRARRSCIKWYLPISLLIVVIVALVFPAPGIVASRTPINTICISSVFFLSGIKLKTDEMRRAIQGWRAALLGFASILGLTPLLAFAVVQLPLAVPEFAAGLAFFMVMPTTISSGYIVTGEAAGNQPLALMLSTGSNLAGAISVPLWLMAVLGSGGVGMDPLPMVVKLLLTVLLPLVVGKSLRYFAWVRRRTARHKVFLKLASISLIIPIPWNSISAASSSFSSVSVASIVLMIVLAVATHAALLAFNILLTALPLLRLGVPERKAIILMASQKTSGIAMAAVVALPPSVGATGLLILPVLIGHLVQILADATISVRLRSWAPAAVATAAATAAAAVSPSSKGCHKKGTVVPLVVVEAASKSSSGTAEGAEAEQVVEAKQDAEEAAGG